jgi:teichuronic acid biosynthesis glycosyltransferase TuaG
MDANMRSDKPELVSIIMPAYNAAPYIADSIKSVLAQTHKNWELIIIDDGSTDETNLVVEKYSSVDKRIRYIYQENARQGKARNNGIAHSLGCYIAFLDSDDLWLPEKLELQLLFLHNNNADFVFSETYVFTDSTELKCLSKKLEIPNVKAPAGYFEGEQGIKVFLQNNQVPILTVLLKRDVINAVGGFAENLLIQNAEDYHLWFKILLHGYKLWMMPQALAIYRVSYSSVSGVDRQNLRQILEVQNDLRRLYPNRINNFDSIITKTILLNLDFTYGLPDKYFFVAVDRFLTIGKKQLFRPIFLFFEKISARHLSLKAAYFVFNYL